MVLPAPTRPMLAKDNKLKDPFSRKDVVLQPKYDGTRVFAVRKGERVYLIAARSWDADYASRYPEIVRELNQIPSKDYRIDGELTFFQKGTDRSKFLTALAKKSTQEKEGCEPKFMVFDIPRYNQDVMHLPLTDRLALLRKVIPGSFRHVKVVETVKNPQEFRKTYRGILKNQGEGVVLKEADSPYVCDSRRHWTKVKKVRTEDCVVIGITYGMGKRAATFGALVLAQYDQSGRLTVVGKCSGFDETTGEQLYRKIMGMPAVKVPTHMERQVKRMVAPGLVVEVRYMERTKDNQLRFPAFVRVRSDKLAKQCVMV